MDVVSNEFHPSITTDRHSRSCHSLPFSLWGPKRIQKFHKLGEQGRARMKSKAQNYCIRALIIYHYQLQLCEENSPYVFARCCMVRNFDRFDQFNAIIFV